MTLENIPFNSPWNDGNDTQTEDLINYTFYLRVAAVGPYPLRVAFLSADVDPDNLRLSSVEQAAAGWGSGHRTCCFREVS